jgi:hypothetical protein
MHLLGWLNIAVVLVVLLGLLWASPLAALVLLLLLAAAVPAVLRLTPRGGVGLRLRRGLLPTVSRRRKGRS